MAPDFGLSGALADETNKVNGVTLVYQEPPEAAHTNKRWRLYTFKGGQCFFQRILMCQDQLSQKRESWDCFDSFKP